MSLNDGDEAGSKLADKVSDASVNPDIVLCSSVEGFRVAKAVSDNLEADLDLRFSESIKVPGESDVIVAGVTDDGTAWVDRLVKDEFNVSGAFIDRARIVKARTLGLKKREYSREDKPVSGKNVLIVDSSVLDSNRIAAVIGSAMKHGAVKVSIAAPEISEISASHLKKLCETVVSLEEGLEPDISRVSQDRISEKLKKHDFT